VIIVFTLALAIPGYCRFEGESTIIRLLNLPPANQSDPTGNPGILALPQAKVQQKIRGLIMNS